MVPTGSPQVLIRQPSLLFGVTFKSIQGSVDVPLAVAGFAAEDVKLEWINLVTIASPPPVSITVLPRITNTIGGVDEVLSYSLAIVADIGTRWLSSIGCDHVKLKVSVPAAAAVGSNGLESTASNTVLVDWYPGAAASIRLRCGCDAAIQQESVVCVG